VVIHRQMTEVASPHGQSPRGKDERACDKEVDNPMGPPPSAKHSMSQFRLKIEWTYRLVKVRRYRGMRTPIGMRMRNEMDIRRA
jgi:hypothetical protein